MLIIPIPYQLLYLDEKTLKRIIKRQVKKHKIPYEYSINEKFIVFKKGKKTSLLFDAICRERIWNIWS